MIRTTTCAVLWVLLALPGCAQGSAPSRSPVVRQVPLNFRGLNQSVLALAGLASRGEVAAVRAQVPGLLQVGLAHLQAPLPHDVARTDVPRYLEGRHVFGNHLTRLAQAREQGDDRGLLEAALALPGALSAWIDAYLGLSPEVAL